MGEIRSLRCWVDDLDTGARDAMCNGKGADGI